MSAKSQWHRIFACHDLKSLAYGKDWKKEYGHKETIRLITRREQLDASGTVH